MRSLLAAICLTLTLGLSACATNKTLEPITGSKADGTVTLSYTFSLSEKPKVDWNLSLQTAKERCQASGYKNANKFGGEQSHCIDFDSYGCNRTQVNVAYQCTNK